MTVSKTTITFTVLHLSDEPLPADLEAVLEATDYGNAVGLETKRETTEIPDDDVQTELLALGNDGEFFDEGDS